jgi:arginyl-tRNA synthetase
VSANKKMIAEHLAELLQLQKDFETPCFTKPLYVAAFLSLETWKNIMTTICYKVFVVSSMARPTYSY